MYGLLGKTLKHSLSKTVHEKWTSFPYHLIETDNISNVLNKKNFSGLNVTIPYKQAVIPYLDQLNEIAKETSTVNTIVQTRGKLIGYNTDVYGFVKLLSFYNVDVKNKNIIILGNGATMRSIAFALKILEANKIFVFARKPNKGEYLLSTLDGTVNASIIINTTPVGMFPNVGDEIIIPDSVFTNTQIAIDVVYNPLRTLFLQKAENYGLKTINGLYMLLAQAAKSIELFHNKKIHTSLINKQYFSLLKRQLNIVLIGMPMSGKSHYGATLKNIYKKGFIDLDSIISAETSMPISTYFQIYGEQKFRELEAKNCAKISLRQNLIIATGGGIILNKQNINYLKLNGIVVFLDMPLNMLINCNPKNRPLLQDKSNIQQLYKLRYPLYKQYADIIIHKSTYNENTVLSQFEVKIDEYINNKWS